MEGFIKYKLLLNKAYEKINKKIYIFSIVFILVFFIIIYFENFSKFPENSYFNNLMVEAGGFLFDILLFGLILGWYEIKKTKSDKIERYIEEIEDYRGWKEKEAGYRIFGSIKRLNKLGIVNFDLKNCYFEDIIFNSEIVNLSNSCIAGATFKKCNLNNFDFSLLLSQSEDFTYTKKTIFINSALKDTKFNNNVYLNISFIKSNMEYSEFTNSTFINCSFLECNFKYAEFKDCIFFECNFDIHPKRQNYTTVSNCDFDEKSDRSGNINYALSE